MRRLLKELHPGLIRELSSELNHGLNVDSIRENSSSKVWWQCRINPKHAWQATIRHRAIDGHGCPYCSGQRVLREDSFAAKYPELVKEWHSSKNKGLDPFLFAPGSNRKVWWCCSNNHEWQAQIRHRVSRRTGCGICAKINKSLAIREPQIANQWHPTRNKDITPYDVVPSSTVKIWWICLDNPTHEWQSSVTSKVRSKTSCPICSNKKKVRHPTLDIFSPELSKQWHPTKNGNLKPNDVYPGTRRKVWWICPVNSDHLWSADISNRALKGRGCPQCARSVVTPEQSLANKFPNIARQWHPIKNKGLKPSDVSYGSAKRVWWQCIKNPSHVWDSTICSRTQKNRDKCPFCSGQRVQFGNSLQDVYPEISSEWHPTKNKDLKPSEVTKASGKKVWWQCKENADHVWFAQIKNRTILKSGCPICSKERAVLKLQTYLIDAAFEHTDFYHIFILNIKNLQKLIEQEKIIGKNLRQPFLRMIYSSTITVLETYLSDAFYQTVIKEKYLIESLLKTSKDFNTRKFSIDDLLSWEQKKSKILTEYLLFDIVWHNIPKVHHLYNLVLKIAFPKDITDVQRAIAIRHDIVHRNGRTKEGKTIRLDSKELLSLFHSVEIFVKYIDRQLKKRATEPIV